MSKDPLSPEQEEQVRRLLADARHTGPTPEDVVARLDRVLADLADEPAREAAVVHLADRRRRAGRMLLAAAAVVVLGVGVGQVVGSGGGDDAPTSGAADSAEEPGALSAQEGESEASGESGAAADQPSALRRPFRITEQRFSREVEDLQTYATSLSAGYGDGSIEEAPGEVADDQDLAAARDRLDRAAVRDVCEPGDWGRGGFVPVVYDASPGWLVLRRAQGDTQVADLFLCGSEQAVRSVTLPFP